jgi:hypothetical protein
MKRKSQQSSPRVRAAATIRKTKPKSSSAAKSMRAKSSREKVRAHRERMRAQGFRLVQMWVPDTREPENRTTARPRPSRAQSRAAADIRKAWAAAIAEPPPDRPVTFADIADLIGSIDGLPADLSSNKDRYLRAGYGRKPHR